MEWNRKTTANTTMREHNQNDVIYLTFPLLDQFDFIKHAFSTKYGGVSEGVYSTMNFSYSRGDDPKHVRENYKRMANALSVSEEGMVVSYQTHTTNIKRVEQEDAGKGVTLERDYHDIDGLVTNVPGLTLVTFYADCVPLYFVDPVHRAIGLSHSGWRGTVARMGEETMKRMQLEFGTKPKDLYACIGPSICQDCYEVSEDVAEQFRIHFKKNQEEQILKKGCLPGKYQLDLWAANRIILEEAGISPEHIEVTDLCTHCNADAMFSHRKSGDKRGNMAAFLGII